MASKPHCPTWYVSPSHTFVARGHVCPFIHCELCKQNVTKTEYEDHLFAHQLESAPAPDTSQDQQYARRLQSQGPAPSRDTRVPPNIEQMMTRLPPEVRNLMQQLHQMQGPGPASLIPRPGPIHQVQRPGPTTIVIRHRLGPAMSMFPVIGGSRGQGLQSAAINDLPTTAYREGGEDRQCVVCITDFQTGEQVRTLPCFHKFHKQCIDEWLARDDKCPICKRPAIQ